MCSIVGVRIIFRALGRNDRKIIIQAIVLGRDIEYEAELAEAVSVNKEMISLPQV